MTLLPTMYVCFNPVESNALAETVIGRNYGYSYRSILKCIECYGHCTGLFPSFLQGECYSIFSNWC
jgi:hypothetical protein